MKTWDCPELSVKRVFFPVRRNIRTFSLTTYESVRMLSVMPPSSDMPTESELAILNVLWQRGPCTVRQVFVELSRRRDELGYTTVLKLMQIMHEKGLVARDESARSHVYRARIQESPTQKKLVAELLQKVFGGSAAKLVMQALSAKRASREELEEIQKLIDRLKGE
jgi:predicted transcriptional regulator